MTDRATLVRLGKLVATDIAAGEPGANSWAASQFLELHPGSVLDLIEMLSDEGRKKRPSDKLISAYAYMIGRALEFARYAVEAGRAQATELADAVRRRVLDLGTSGQVEPALLMMILREFSAAKLDPGAELRGLMASLMEQVATDKGGGGGIEDLGSYIDELAKAVGGDPFALQAQMHEMAGSFPEDQRAVIGAWLLHSSLPPAQEAAIGWLFDSSAEVRNAMESEIEQAAPKGVVSGTVLRRLLALRNWLPEANRPPLDRAIQACSRKGVECAAWPQVQVRAVLASGIDGAGAQSIFVLARDGRQSTMGCLLIKRGVGVRDAWTRRGLTRKEVDEFFDQVAGGMDVFPIALDHVRTAAAHFLAVNLASGVMPPFAMLDFVETAGLQGIQPGTIPIDVVLGMLEDEPDPASLRPEAVTQLLARSRDLPGEFGFLDSWFEDDAQVERLLEGKRIARAKRIALVRDALLPKHSAKWAELLAWTALTLRHCEEEVPWPEFFVSAKELVAGRPAAEIPLMAHVADITVDAYLESQSARQMPSRRSE